MASSGHKNLSSSLNHPIKQTIRQAECYESEPGVIFSSLLMACGEPSVVGETIKVQSLSQESPLVPIGAAAKKAGVSRQSLQYYLMVGLLEPTEVTATGRRLFDNQCIERVKLIRKLNDSGYPLRAIRELFLEGRTDMKGPKK
jgi:hypothetical protein